VTARYGNYSDRYIEGAVNLPLADGIALRVAGKLDRRDGFAKNLAGPDDDNQNYETFRSSLQIAPAGSRFENLTVVNYARINESGMSVKLTALLPDPPVNGGAPYSPTRQAELEVALTPGPRTVSTADPGFSRAHNVASATSRPSEFSGFEEIYYGELRTFGVEASVHF
jgi:hypothetical protein